MPRIFIAINFKASEPLRDALQALRGIGHAMRPVSADHLHLTLRFLGEMEAARIPAVAALMDDALRDTSSYDLTLQSLGVFPNVSRPAVVWVGVHDDGQTQQLWQQLSNSLLALDVPMEDRSFHGHVTLARVKGRAPRALRDFLAQHKDTLFARRRVKSVELMQSALTDHGPIYSVVHTVKFS